LEKKKVIKPPQKKVRALPFVLARWRQKQKGGVEQERVSQVILANAWFGPSDPFANETSQHFRPCVLPFAHWFLLGLCLTRVSQVRMWEPFN
jgi:hypothetical protein